MDKRGSKQAEIDGKMRNTESIKKKRSCGTDFAEWNDPIAEVQMFFLGGIWPALRKTSLQEDFEIDAIPAGTITNTPVNTTTTCETWGHHRGTLTLRPHLRFRCRSSATLTYTWHCGRVINIWIFTSSPEQPPHHARNFSDITAHCKHVREHQTPVLRQSIEGQSGSRA